MTLTSEGVLVGRLASLRPRTPDDVPAFVRWYSDPDVRHWLHLSETPLSTPESERMRYEMSERDQSRLNWMIDAEDGVTIGTISIAGIERLHGRGELGISIGEKEYWGRGYGADAIRTLLRYAFDDMGLRRITLITDVDNDRGIRCYENAGFLSEGTLRGHRLRHGEPIDMLAMGVNHDSWPG